MSGRLVAWTIELSQFHIEFIPRSAIKAQALSDFVAECQFSPTSIIEESHTTKPWTLFLDGSSTKLSGGAGIILISPEGFKIQQALKFSFPVTNNVAEYEALIGGVRLAIKLQVKILDIFRDSQLVVKQLTGEFKVHSERMAAYLALSLELLQKNPILENQEHRTRKESMGRCSIQVGFVGLTPREETDLCRRANPVSP